MLPTTAGMPKLPPQQLAEFDRYLTGVERHMAVARDEIERVVAETPPDPDSALTPNIVPTMKIHANGELALRDAQRATRIIDKHWPVPRTSQTVVQTGDSLLGTVIGALFPDLAPKERSQRTYKKEWDRDIDLALSLLQDAAGEVSYNGKPGNRGKDVWADTHLLQFIENAEQLTPLIRDMAAGTADQAWIDATLKKIDPNRGLDHHPNGLPR